jgi:tetratricopeptide (TPR) repeat protein
VARRGAANVRDGGRASAAWRAAGDAARDSRRRSDGAPGRPPRREEAAPEVVVPADLVEETPVDRASSGEPARKPRDEARVLRAEEGLDAEDLGWGDGEAGAAWQPEEWIDEGLVRDEAQGAVQRGRRSGPGRPERGRRGSGPGGAAKRWSPMAGTEDEEVAAAQQAEGRERRSGKADASLEAELRSAVGATKAARFEQRMRDAGAAFKRSRYDEVRRILRPMVDQAPRVAALRELYGLTLYRLERWRAAANELEALRTLTGGVEQHPVLADCYRALGRHADVEDLWNELAAASPNAALVAEGRIVAAGDLADQGRVDEAIALLEPGLRPARRAKDHHLRVAYALADLYERAGDLPRARELFERVAGGAPDFVDIQARIRALG